MTFLRACKRLVLGVVGLSMAVGAMCHGYLSKPAARNVQHNSDYCPHCLNGPGVCGDASGRSDHEPFGMYATPPDIAATYSSGGVLRARVVITANHQGRWSLRLCPLRDSSQEAERDALRLGTCFERLKLVNGGGSYVYLPSSASKSSASFRLPRGTRCRRCVVQWRWETGNSCNPKGTPSRYANPGLEECGSRNAPPGEQFTNCADIRIV